MFIQIKIYQYTAEFNMELDKINQAWMNVYLYNSFEIF